MYFTNASSSYVCVMLDDIHVEMSSSRFHVVLLWMSRLILFMSSVVYGEYIFADVCVHVCIACMYVAP